MGNDKTEHSFDQPATPGKPTGPQHHFKADVPTGARKEPRRGGFASDFTPRRETRSFDVPAPEAGGASGAIGTPGASGVKAPEMSTRTVSPTPPSTPEVPYRFDGPFERMRLAFLFLLLLPLTLIAYWPALTELVHKWSTNIDYGHGFFVIPIVALCLYLRFDAYPGTRYGVSWIGLAPILVCFVIRYFAASWYADVLDQWSILFWIFGIVWFFYGHRVFLWALPSLSFLIFMFSLPYRYEQLLRNQLQQVAAQFAAMILQILGEPAIPIKNTIRLSSEELAVDMACSGIRFLISILAIAFAAILLMRRPWWQNIFVLLIAVPLALFVNAARIAMTGILLVHFRGMLESWAGEGQRVSVLADEIAGMSMVVVAIVLFFAFLGYLGKVFKRVEI